MALRIIKEDRNIIPNLPKLKHNCEKKFNMKVSIDIQTSYERIGDDFIVSAVIIKDGNSFEAHAHGCELEEIEDLAINRAKKLLEVFSKR